MSQEQSDAERRRKDVNALDGEFDVIYMNGSNNVPNLKTSIFIDPATRTPGVRQMTEIAKSLCAFMNADGGELYIGVRDNGDLVGIDDDLRILGMGNIIAEGTYLRR